MPVSRFSSKKEKKRKAHQHVRTFHPKPHPLCFQGTPNPSCNLRCGKLPEVSAFYPMVYLELYLELILPNNLFVLLFIPRVNLISDIVCTFSAFLFIYLFFFVLFHLVDKHVCASHACPVSMEVRQGVRSYGIEWQVVVSCHVCSRTQTQVLQKNS